ncbi:MAG: DUF4230 domain-containing protein [Kiritimatiellales bacterium]|nr:DUF4230 domain-containing protein [Kiritimatiellales bacterium]
MTGFSSILTLALVVAAFFGGVWLSAKFRKRKPAATINVFSSIEQMRSIGILSVFKVMTKEIVTETDHSWGELGNRYLSWVLTKKKMAMIFEFEIDFRYDLQSPAFQITGLSNEAHVIKMPPCDYGVHIRDIRFYDEQRSKLMPWLLPDLLNGFLGGGFSEQDKNGLVDAAKAHAEKQAMELIGNIQSEVRNSAKTTLQSISRAFGANDVRFEFSDESRMEVEVAVSESLAASA